MKFISSVCFFIIFINSFAQTNSGEVVYSIQRKNIKTDSTEIYADFRQKIYETTKRLEFYLVFNKSTSKFSLREDLELDTNNYFLKMAKLATRGNSSFTYSMGKDFLIERTEFGGEVYLIETKENEIQWTFENIKKEIAGYTCYKATATIVNLDHSDKKLEQSYIAWYSPKIPFNYGPFEFNGLPGLVLEFSDNTKTFTAKKVKLVNDALTITPFTKGIRITKNDFNKLLKNTFNKLSH